MNKPFWYPQPDSMTSKEWKHWNSSTKEQYPIQFFFRETLDIEWHCFKRIFREKYYIARSWIKPAHPLVRKALPRTWSDLTETMINLNLAIIVQFKIEADESWVDWTSDEYHKQFKVWLDDAADYVNVRRPKLQEQLDQAYPTKDVDWMDVSADHIPYEVEYAEVIRLEKLIADTDTKIIKEMVDRREGFWT